MKTIMGVQKRLAGIYNYISEIHREMETANLLSITKSNKILNHVFHEVSICLRELADIQKQIKSSLEEHK